MKRRSAAPTFIRSVVAWPGLGRAIPIDVDRRNGHVATRAVRRDRSGRGWRRDRRRVCLRGRDGQGATGATGRSATGSEAGGRGSDVTGSVGAVSIGAGGDRPIRGRVGTWSVVAVPTVVRSAVVASAHRLRDGGGLPQSCSATGRRRRRNSAWISRSGGRRGRSGRPWPADTPGRRSTPAASLGSGGGSARDDRQFARCRSLRSGHPRRTRRCPRCGPRIHRRSRSPARR